MAATAVSWTGPPPLAPPEEGARSAENPVRSVESSVWSFMSSGEFPRPERTRRESTPAHRRSTVALRFWVGAFKPFGGGTRAWDGRELAGREARRVRCDGGRGERVLALQAFERLAQAACLTREATVSRMGPGAYRTESNLVPIAVRPGIRRTPRVPAFSPGPGGRPCGPHSGWPQPVLTPTTTGSLRKLRDADALLGRGVSSAEVGWKLE